MKLTVRRFIGKEMYSFTFDGETLFDVVMASQHLGFYSVSQCGACGGNLLSFRAYVTEKDKYEYVKITCNKPECRAQATFGVAKRDGAFFLRKNESGQIIWEKVPEKTNGGS